jgi:hypothetical protein
MKCWMLRWVGSMMAADETEPAPPSCLVLHQPFDGERLGPHGAAQRQDGPS